MLKQKSLLARAKGFSHRLADGCRLTHTAESSFRHLCEGERERGAESEGAPWKQLQQHKMEFVSTLPMLCTYSIHLSDTVDFPPLTFFTFRVLCQQTLGIYNEICMLSFAFVENAASDLG